jgi:hypothetical protein
VASCFERCHIDQKGNNVNLRTSRKIVKAIQEGRADRYTQLQSTRAMNRVERTASAKASQRFWMGLMDRIGVSGRAEVLAKTGAPSMAFDLLMRSPENQWNKTKGK